MIRRAHTHTHTQHTQQHPLTPPTPLHTHQKPQNTNKTSGRLYSQTTTESWVLLALLQAKVIASLGAQPEVLTVGANPHTTEHIDTHVVLVSSGERVEHCSFCLDFFLKRWQVVCLFVFGAPTHLL